MFDITWTADLDAGTACEVVSANQAALREQEFTELALAAHWADLHPAPGVVRPARPFWVDVRGAGAVVGDRGRRHP